LNTGTSHYTLVYDTYIN